MKILKEITPEVEKLFKDKNFASFATMMDRLRRFGWTMMMEIS